MWSDAAREASAIARKGAGKVIGAAQRVSAAAHQSKVMQALNKDRFTRAVPPGSKRDTFVKQAASWAGTGLTKGAVLAMGGGAVGVAGALTASYTKWGGDAVRKYGPKIKAMIAAQRKRQS